MAQKDKKDYERILAYNPHYDPANIVYDNGQINDIKAKEVQYAR